MHWWRCDLDDIEDRTDRLSSKSLGDDGHVKAAAAEPEASAIWQPRRTRERVPTVIRYRMSKRLRTARKRKLLDTAASVWGVALCPLDGAVANESRPSRPAISRGVASLVTAIKSLRQTTLTTTETHTVTHAKNFSAADVAFDETLSCHIRRMNGDRAKSTKRHLVAFLCGNLIDLL